MSANFSTQPSLLDASVYEAAAVFHVGQSSKNTREHGRPDNAEEAFVFTQSQRANRALSTPAPSLTSRMTQLLEALPGGVVVLDGDGVVQQCNSAAVDLLGTPLEGESWIAVIQRAFRPTGEDGHDMSLSDGRLVHVSTQPLEGEPGQIILLQDVTETRQLQHKVAHLQRLSALGEMAARLAHQIRTPLSSALLYLSPLLKDEADPKLKQRFAKRLHHSITHMEHLVKDMLAFSRGDMAQAKPISVSELLSAIEQQFLSHPGSEKVRFSIENHVKDGYIYGSHDALCSAVNNLLNNARQACHGNGDITLYVEQVENAAGKPCIEISVEDNGDGIDEDDQQKILTPFFTTRSSGTGLGLAVVKSIVEAHHGELFFESVPGEGSTFTLQFPQYMPADQFSLMAQQR